MKGSYAVLSHAQEQRESVQWDPLYRRQANICHTVARTQQITGSAILPLAIWTHCARSPLQSLLQHRHTAIDSSGTPEYRKAVSKRLVDFRGSRCVDRATRHVGVRYRGWTALIPRQLRAIAATGNDRPDRPVCADTAPSSCQDSIFLPRGVRQHV